jgi:sodium/proline symporter
MKLTVLILYILIIYIIGAISSKYTKTSSDYLLGSRKLNTITTAFGVGASDMSGWLMMAVPGAFLMQGMVNIWIPIGLIIGAYANWNIVGKRLRSYTEKYGNALTIPWYLSNRFNDKTNTIRIATASILLIFFTVYASTGLIACALIIQNEFALSYTNALWISAAIIVIYTSIGGFIAVSWIDVFQGILMLIAILIVPYVALQNLGGMAEISNVLSANNINYSDPFKDKTILEIISMLSWGLGYFGQLHILLRFMAAKSPEVIGKSQKICMTWMITAFAGAGALGLVGAALFAKTPLDNPETIFFKAADILFPPWASGMLLAAIFSAIMSTISAQLLASSSAITEDILLRFTNRISDKKRLLLNRMAVICIMIAATVIARNPQSSILSLVAHAWAGLGASFGPVILLSLYWNKMTKAGAVSGILTGGITVLAWEGLQGSHPIFEIYEIIPAFLLSSLAIYVGSKIEKEALA